MRKLVGCLAVVAGLFFVFLFLAVFGLFFFRGVAHVPAPMPARHVVLGTSPDGNNRTETMETRASQAASARLTGFLLVLGCLALVPVLAIAVVVWLLVALAGKEPARGGPTVFDLALAVHRKLESCEGRIERLESRLLERVDGPRASGGQATQSGEGL